MNKIVFIISESEDFHYTLSELTNLHIIYVHRKYESPVFTFSNNSHYFGEIEIFEENKDKVIEVLGNKKYLIYSKSNVVIEKNTPKNTSFLQYWKIALIIYSIGMTYLAWNYWSTIKNASIENKNYTQEWIEDGTIFSQVDRRTQKQLSKSYDRNLDGNCELVEEFAHNKKIKEWFDNNEDGYFEKGLVYSLDQQIIEYHTDNNADGIYETVDIILENKDTLHLTDKNANGIFELNSKK